MTPEEADRIVKQREAKWEDFGDGWSLHSLERLNVQVDVFIGWEPVKMSEIQDFLLLVTVDDRTEYKQEYPIENLDECLYHGELNFITQVDNQVGDLRRESLAQVGLRHPLIVDSQKVEL